MSPENSKGIYAMNETTTIDAPEPGVYPGVPMSVYHSWPCASNSQLTHLLKSPAHMKAYRETPQKETPAKILGTAIHSLVLEPDDFERTYYAKPDPDPAIYRNADGGESKNPAATKDYKAAVALLEQEHPGGYALGSADFDRCRGVGSAIQSHAVAGPMVRAATEVELSVVWIDPITGVKCKARFDAYAPDLAGGSIPDLKTALDGDLIDFEKAVLKWGYHRKAWFYLRGAQEVGLPAKHFPIIAAEKEPPFAVAVYRISDGVVTYLEQQMTALLELYALCEARQQWPAYPERVREISIPEWGWRHIDDQTAEVQERITSFRASANKEQAA